MWDFRIQGPRIQGFRIQDFNIQDFGFRGQDYEYRIEDLGVGKLGLVLAYHALHINMPILIRPSAHVEVYSFCLKYQNPKFSGFQSSGGAFIQTKSLKGRAGPAMPEARKGPRLLPAAAHAKPEHPKFSSFQSSGGAFIQTKSLKGRAGPAMPKARKGPRLLPAAAHTKPEHT